MLGAFLPMIFLLRKKDVLADMHVFSTTKKECKSTPFLLLVSQSQAKSNSACPTLIDLELAEFNPPVAT
jgi:hypothetical protein